MSFVISSPERDKTLKMISPLTFSATMPDLLSTFGDATFTNYQTHKGSMILQFRNELIQQLGDTSFEANGLIRDEHLGQV